MKKEKRYLTIGIIIISFLLGIALIGLFWTPYSTTQMNAELKNQAPTLAHIFGTDNYGRDIFSRVMSGIGITFIIAISTVLIGAVVGSIVGLFTGYYGGIFDEIVMRFNDVILSFPSVLLALVLISLLGKGKYKIILALGLLFIPSFARMIRGETIKIKNLGYVESAKALGIPEIKIIFKHIFPNVIPKLLTNMTVGFNNAVIAEASMSYLGLGVQPPEASLGRMMSEAQSYIFVAPWYALCPGVVVIMLILGFSLIGEGLQTK
jgi:peptide/nickel transport system permease protein